MCPIDLLRLLGSAAKTKRLPGWQWISGRCWLLVDPAVRGLFGGRLSYFRPEEFLEKVLPKIPDSAVI